MANAYFDRYITVPGSGSAAVQIDFTVGCRHVEVVEQPDPTTFTGSFTATGMVAEIPNNSDPANYAAAFTPNESVLTTGSYSRGNQIAEADARGPLVGGPAQKDPAGRTIAARSVGKFRSATAGATKVRVRETP